MRVTQDSIMDNWYFCSPRMYYLRCVWGKGETPSKHRRDHLRELSHMKCNTPDFSGVASSINEGDIFIYLCSAQLTSFEIDLISKEINCAKQEYMNMSSSLGFNCLFIASQIVLFSILSSHDFCDWNVSFPSWLLLKWHSFICYSIVISHGLNANVFLLFWKSHCSICYPGQSSSSDQNVSKI